MHTQAPSENRVNDLCKERLQDTDTTIRSPSELEPGSERKSRRKRLSSTYTKCRSRSWSTSPCKRRKTHEKSRKDATTDQFGGSSDDSRLPRSHHSKKSFNGSSKSRRQRKRNEGENKDLEGVSPVNERYWTGLDYHTYCFPKKSKVYDEQVVKHVSKWASWL